MAHRGLEVTFFPILSTLVLLSRVYIGGDGPLVLVALVTRVLLWIFSEDLVNRTSIGKYTFARSLHLKPRSKYIYWSSSRSFPPPCLRDGIFQQLGRGWSFPHPSLGLWHNPYTYGKAFKNANQWVPDGTEIYFLKLSLQLSFDWYGIGTAPPIEFLEIYWFALTTEE